jgi:hypothetical protein
MFPATSHLVPFAVKSCRQIVPPVLATLIAAGLISAYNRAFSGQLQQPRMSALHEAHAAQGTMVPITTVGMTKPPAPPMPAVTQTITIYEETTEPERLAEKDSSEEADRDQSAIKLAEPAPAPAMRTASPRPEPQIEPHRVASIEPAQPPVVRAPVPMIVAVPPAVVTPPAAAPVVVMPAPLPPQLQPPPVIVGTPPIVTVPDRPNARPIEDAQVQPPPQPAQGALGKFVNAMKPSTWFAAARQFGDKIEAAGNDILPNVRQ